MAGRDWLVTEDGRCEACQISASLSNRELLAKPYRLYRFLTDLEDILKQIKDDRRRLEAIRPLVRRLLMSSYWLQTRYLPPDPKLGWSVLKLYDEPYFPFTVQMAAWLPGKVSPIHNHATWGVVALISGLEKNVFWQRSPSERVAPQLSVGPVSGSRGYSGGSSGKLQPDRAPKGFSKELTQDHQPAQELDQNQVKPVSTRVLVPGDVIGFTPEVIHSIETTGDKPTITFNVYGEMNGQVIYFNSNQG